MCCPDAPHVALGLCSIHYQRRKAWKRGVQSTTPHEMEWLEGIVAQAKSDKKARAAENSAARRKRANTRRRVDKGYRWTTIKYRYGVTKAFIYDLRQKQQNMCALCGSGGQLYIDHCHTTNTVRGLLCPGCNTMIGALEKRGHLLAKAQAYIEARGIGTDDRPNTETSSSDATGSNQEPVR